MYSLDHNTVRNLHHSRWWLQTWKWTHEKYNKVTFINWKYYMLMKDSFLMFQLCFFSFLDFIGTVWIHIWFWLRQRNGSFRLGSSKSSYRKYGSSILIAYQSAFWDLFPTLNKITWENKGSSWKSSGQRFK